MFLTLGRWPATEGLSLGKEGSQEARGRVQGLERQLEVLGVVPDPAFVRDGQGRQVGIGVVHIIERVGSVRFRQFLELKGDVDIALGTFNSDLEGQYVEVGRDVGLDSVQFGSVDFDIGKPVGRGLIVHASHSERLCGEQYEQHGVADTCWNILGGHDRTSVSMRVTGPINGAGLYELELSVLASGFKRWVFPAMPRTCSCLIVCFCCRIPGEQYPARRANAGYVANFRRLVGGGGGASDPGFLRLLPSQFLVLPPGIMRSCLVRVWL